MVALSKRPADIFVPNVPRSLPDVRVLHEQTISAVENLESHVSTIEARGVSQLMPCNAIATDNVNITSPGHGLFNTTLYAGISRVLLVFQTAKAENGVWIWNGDNVPLTRATDANEASELGQSSVFIRTVDTVGGGRTYFCQQTAGQIAANGGVGVAALTYVVIGENPSNAATLSQIANVPRRGWPFLGNYTITPYLQDLITDAHIFHTSELTGSLYISRLEVQPYRILIAISDYNSGTAVCQTTIAGTISDFTTLPPVLKLDQDSLSTYSGITAVITFNWAAAVTGTYTYTSPTQSGLHADAIHTADSMNDFSEVTRTHETLHVGATGSYSTINASLAMIYDGQAWPAWFSSSFKTCARSAFTHQILIDVDGGVTDQTTTGIVLPEFVSIRGAGPGSTVIYGTGSSDSGIVTFNYTGRLERLSIVSDTGNGGSDIGKYCVHNDDFNRSSSKRNNRIHQVVRDVELIGGVNQRAALWGGGFSSGQHLLMDTVRGRHLGPATMTSPCFSLHDTKITPSTIGGLIEVRSCSSDDFTGLQLLSLGGAVKNVVRLTDSKFNLISLATTDANAAVADVATDRTRWILTGTHSGAIDTWDDGMIVLKAPTGAAVSGSAVDLIFGSLDEINQGLLCIAEDGTAKSLGARLGNRASSTKTLTIGGVTYTFNQDYTLQSNATIISAINAIITANPVGSFNVSLQQYPDLGERRRCYNASGATIARGKLVKLVAGGSIALASGDDDVFGFVVKETRTNSWCDVVVGRKISARLIPNATSGYPNFTSVEGWKFGVTNGDIDFTATNDKGFVANGIVTLY